MPSSSARVAPGISLSEFSILKDLLTVHQKLTLTVMTGSMSPLIPAGTQIEVKPCRVPPRRFDILVFLDRHRLICHFVWAKKSRPDSSFFVTRGLTTQRDNQLLSEIQILGVVTSHSIGRSTKMHLLIQTFFRQMRAGIVSHFSSL